MKDTYSTLTKFQKQTDPKTPVSGVVQAVRGNLVDVAVRSMSAVLRAVPVVGGKPDVGMTVSLKWEAGKPVAYVLGSTDRIALAAVTKGDKGDVGPQGPQGPQGIQGVAGSLNSEAGGITLQMHDNTVANPSAGDVILFVNTDGVVCEQYPDGGVKRVSSAVIKLYAFQNFS